MGSAIWESKGTNMRVSLWIELNQLTGVAAILRFPLADMDELEDSDDDFDDASYVEEYIPG